MNFDRKDIVGIALFFIIFAVGLVFVFSIFGLFSMKEYTNIFGEIFFEFAMLSMMMISITVLFNCKFTEGIYARKMSLIQTVLCIVCMSLIALIPPSIDREGDPMYFNCAPVLIFFIGAWCGPHVCIPVSVIASGVMVMTHFPVFPASTVTMSLINIEFAVCSSYVSLRSVPDRKRTMAAALFATAIGFIITSIDLVFNPKSSHEHLVCSFTSLITLLILIVFFVYLMEVIRDVKERLIAFDRSREELALAHDIQQSYLTKVFPNAHSMDFYAFMEPAASIGGDFYDIYRINHNLTFMVVADVSDKGLPASMLMMRAMGMIRSASSVSNDPGTIISILNSQLCESNPTGQFITAFVGVYDSDTGLFAYSNAGHTPPYIRRSDGPFERLKVPKGLIIGVNGSVKYKTAVIKLHNKDAIFCYTDGVNEAFNAEDEMFGYQRLERVLNASEASTAQVLIGNVNTAIRAFVGGREMSDDVTMLSFIVYRDWYRHEDFDADAGNLDSVKSFIRSVLAEAKCSEKRILKMEIVAEEIFVNICDHAYGGKGGNVTVYCSCHENEVKMTFTDGAMTFDPLKKEDIVIDDDINNWKIGGFGIHMVKRLVTYMAYKRFCGLNILTVWAVADESLSLEGDVTERAVLP